MKVAKWGNSLAVRLPKAMVEALGLRAGDDVDVALTAAPNAQAVARTERTRWLEEMRKYQGRLPAGFKFDRDEANSRDD